MLLDCYEDAWAASDAIDARARAAGMLDPQRFWDGAPVSGRRVMLRCLHGFGDALQFIRYAPRIGEQAASLCVEAHPEIVSLLRACAGVDHVISWGPDAPAEQPVWDAQVEIMEVPRIFRATFATLPRAVPYLDFAKLAPSPSANDSTRQMERRRSRGRVQVGISWRSSEWNPLRSLPLGLLTAALRTLGRCDFYSLQQGGARDLADEPGTPVENIEAEFAELAVRMAHLDVVLTIDGVLAHLAGALGLPVLLLLPFAADWRWGLRDTTPWYAHTRLFRQPAPGEWASPVAGAIAALRHLTGS